MAYGTPTDPVGGTVITVAYAVANILDPIRWLRIMTGGGDPPGSNYVIRAINTTSTDWSKVTSDMLADNAVILSKIYAGGTGNRILRTSDGVSTIWGQLGTNDIAAGAIDSPALGAGSVLDAKIATVSGSKIIAGTLGTAAFGAGVVDNNALGASSITNVKVNDVSGSKIIGGNITSPPTINSGTIWHSGNDGAGSGLDADNLDGLTWKAPITGEYSGTQALTSSYADISGASASADRDGKWVVTAVAEYIYGVGDGSPYVQIVAGATPQEEGVGAFGSAAGVANAVSIVTVSGTTTIKLQVKKAGGSGTSYCSYAKFTAVWVSP